MRAISVFTHVVPMLACVVASVDAQSSSSSVFDKLRSSRSLDSSKSAMHGSQWSPPSVFDTSKKALDDLRTSITDATTPSKEAYDDSTVIPTSTPTDPIATPTTDESPTGPAFVRVLRVFLGVGMLACVAFFCCSVEPHRSVIPFLLFLCVLLLISPSIVDDEQATFLAYASSHCDAQSIDSELNYQISMTLVIVPRNFRRWSTPALLVSTLFAFGTAHCISWCCEKQAPFSIMFYLIVLDILLVYWRIVTSFGFGWVSWFIGFIGSCLILIFGYLICGPAASDPHRSQRPATRSFDSYSSYQSLGPMASIPNRRYEDPYSPYTPANARPNNPPNPAPVAVGMPLRDARRADVELCRVARPYEIEEGSTGHTYAKIFAPYINASLTCMTIEEPWLQERYQFAQLKDFLKVFVERAINLRNVSVLTQRATGDDEAEQATRRTRQERDLTEIKGWLGSKRVSFRWDYEEFHDRWIRLDNGWKATIGRGLSFYHPSSCPADRDFAKRRCRKTTVTFVTV